MAEISKKRRGRGWLILLLVLILIIAGATLAYRILSKRLAADHPFVLIHSPSNHADVESGEQVMVHATARSDDGISKMEFWVDETLVAVREPEMPTTTTALTGEWLAHLTGDHALVIRAYTGRGVEGTSAISITVNESTAEEAPPTHTVAEGEDIASIAEDYGTTPEEIEAANPGGGSGDGGGFAPGDELTLPDDEPEAPPADGPVPVPEDAPPDPEADEPGSLLYVLDFFFGASVAEFLNPTPTEGPILLKIEALELESRGMYEDVHCYIGIGGNPPKWYPDVDGDQTTDESFDPLHGGWNVAEYLAGENALHLIWEASEPLRIESHCVGIGFGGTDAIEMGVVDILTASEGWDGSVREAMSTGGESSYRLTYRISVEDEGSPTGVPKYLDPTMTPPTNLHYDSRRIEIQWDYEPREDETPIDGFGVFLNETLQWTVGPDDRASGIPYEWLTPPCDQTYRVTVNAFRGHIPDGPESPTASPEVTFTTDADDCNREIHITFDTLETFELGGDGRYEDRTGDVGPVYGAFYANEREISFDGRGSDSGGGRLDYPMGLYDNTLYDIFEMWGDSSWEFSGMPSAIVDIEPGGSFVFGFRVRDNDTGYCWNSGSPGCDDNVCSAESQVYEDDSYTELDFVHEGTMMAENGRCALNYTWGPAPGSPVGTEGDWGPPLPWIEVEQLEVVNETGEVRVHVRNTGTATWPWQDLELRMQTRDGEELGFFTWEEFELEPGERATLSAEGMRVDAPYDVCVVLDPNDHVLEYYERSGALTHHPICVERPDLIITDVRFDPLGGGRLRVTVENDSDNPLIDRQVGFEVINSAGENAYLGSSWPVDYLAAGGTRTFDLTGVNENARDRIADGYTVTVNPDRLFAEESYENNDYVVGGTKMVQIFWCNRNIPHMDGLSSSARIYFDAYVVSGAVSTQVLDTSWTHHLSGQEVIWNYDHNEFGHPGGSYSCYEVGDPFEISGDQWLQLDFQGKYRPRSSGSYDNIGSNSVTFGPPEWGSGYLDPDAFNDWSACGDDGGRHGLWTSFVRGLGTYEWYTRFLVCEMP